MYGDSYLIGWFGWLNAVGFFYHTRRAYVDIRLSLYSRPADGETVAGRRCRHNNIIHEEIIGIGIGIDT